NTVTLTITDANGNFDTCTATVLVENLLPATFSNCPGDLTFYLDANECFSTVSGTDPGIVSNCDAGYSYEITGATTGNGTGNVDGVEFSPGLSTVTYTADQGGNTCAFQVYIEPTQTA